MSGQVEVVGLASVNLSELMPAIGNFIKFIPNDFWTLQENNKEFSKVFLLDSIRVRFILANVSRQLKSHNKKGEKRIFDSNDRSN